MDHNDLSSGYSLCSLHLQNNWGLVIRRFIILHRVHTLLSSSNSMTFHDFFHDFFKFSKTIGLAVTFTNLRTFLALEYFLTLNSWTDTNSGVHQNACRLRCLITLYLTLSLLCHLKSLTYQRKLQFSMTFKDQQLNSMTFQAWKIKFLNSMTFQVFHDLYEPCRRKGNFYLWD